MLQHDPFKAWCTTIVSSGEALGAWRKGAVFAYRKQLSTLFMVLSTRATVSLSLSLHTEVHIIDGDESSAFDKPLHAYVRLLTAATSRRSDFGGCAHDF